MSPLPYSSVALDSPIVDEAEVFESDAPIHHLDVRKLSSEVLSRPAMSHVMTQPFDMVLDFRIGTERACVLYSLVTVVATSDMRSCRLRHPTLNQANVLLTFISQMSCYMSHMRVQCSS